MRAIIELFIIVAATAGAAPASAAPPEFVLEDSHVQMRLFATDDNKESFVSAQFGPQGQMFVGSREAVFVFDREGDSLSSKPVLLHRFGQHKWAMGLAVRGHDLYVGCHDAIWLLKDAVVKRSGIEAKKIIWGVPTAMWNSGWIHQNLHEVRWGPDGRMYFSMGDLAWAYGDPSRPDHWVRLNFETAGSPAKVPITACGGGIYRCDPDGSHLELIATGTRNTCGICFDPGWNLFTTDNDHENNPAFCPSRLLQIVPGGFYGWPRYWMDDRPDALPAMTGMGRDVPVALAYYSHPAIAEYEWQLLLCRWGQRRLTRYAVTPRGASFAGREEPLLQTVGDARPVGVTVAPDGRIYAVICYMDHNEASPGYGSKILEFSRAGDQKAHAGYEPYDPTTATHEKLRKELDNPSLLRRQFAHEEFLRRGGDDRDLAAATMSTSLGGGYGQSPRPASKHGIHLAVASRSKAAKEMLRALANDNHPASRYQAMIAAENWPDALSLDDLLPRLRDDSPMVRRAAVAVLARSSAPLPITEFARDVLANTDAFIRQPGAILAGQRASTDELLALLKSSDAQIRLGGVLAIGFKLTIPPAATPLPTALELVKPSEPQPPGVVPNLGMFIIHNWHKAMGPTPDRVKLLNAMLQAAREDADAAIRVQALRSIILLRDPAAMDTLWAIYERNEADTRELCANGLLAMDLPADRREQMLSAFVVDKGVSDKMRGQAVDKTMDIFGLRKVALARTLMPVVRAQAMRRLATLHDGGLTAVASMVDAGEDPALHRAVDQALGRNVQTAPVRDNAKQIEQKLAGADWDGLWKKGNAANGKTIFARRNAGGVSCQSCHTKEGQGGKLAPSLDDAHLRLKPAYIAESILYPSRQVVPEHRTFMFHLHGGQTRSGVVVGEDAFAVTIGKTDGTTESLPLGTIADRVADEISIMPAGQVPTLPELTDLVAYLMTPVKKDP